MLRPSARQIIFKIMVHNEVRERVYEVVQEYKREIEMAVQECYPDGSAYAIEAFVTRGELPNCYCLNRIPYENWDDYNQKIKKWSNKTRKHLHDLRYSLKKLNPVGICSNLIFIIRELNIVYEPRPFCRL
jgi:hypothetical protein